VNYPLEDLLPLAESHVTTKWPFYKKRYLGDREDLVNAAAAGLLEWAATQDDPRRLPSRGAIKAVRAAIRAEVVGLPRLPPTELALTEDGLPVNPDDLAAPADPPKVTAATRFRRLWALANDRTKYRLDADEKKLYKAFRSQGFDIAAAARRLEITEENCTYRLDLLVRKVAAVAEIHRLP
jgi:hypothetical protein